MVQGKDVCSQAGPTDILLSLCRHLADKWEKTIVTHPTKTFKNKLDQMEVLVLLDLLGGTNSQFPNFYRSTSWLYNKLIALEERLNSQSALKTTSALDGEALISAFNPSSFLTYRGEQIGDDHVPFLARGVNVLHMIPYPFPKVWHNRLVNTHTLLL